MARKPQKIEADLNKEFEARFTKLDSKSQIKPTGESVRKSIQNLTAHMNDVSAPNASVALVQQNFEIVNKKIDLVGEQFVKIDRRFDDHERIVREKFSTVTSSFVHHHYKLNQELNKSFDLIADDISTFDKKLDRQSYDIDRLRSEINFLKLSSKETEIELSRQRAPERVPDRDREKSGISAKAAGIGLLAGGALGAALLWAYNNKETLMKLAKTAESIGEGIKTIHGALGTVGSIKGAHTAMKVGKASKSVILAAVGKSAKKHGWSVFGKKIPFFSALLGLGLAAYRYSIGDKEGAALEAGSGIAGMIPGVGSAVGIAADLGIIARDAYHNVYGIYPREDPLASERYGELYEVVVEYITGTSSKDIEKDSNEKTSGALNALQKSSEPNIQVPEGMENKTDASKVEIKLQKDFLIDSIRKINIESKDEIRLKANKIILDAPSIEIRAPKNALSFITGMTPHGRVSKRKAGVEDPRTEMPDVPDSAADVGGSSEYDDEMLPPIDIIQTPSAVTAPTSPSISVLRGPSGAEGISGPAGSPSGPAASRSSRSSTKPTSAAPIELEGATSSEKHSIEPTVKELGQFIPGGVDRTRFESELKDPKVLEKLFTMTEAEVGGQGRAAQLAFMETVFNRAMASGKSLNSILSSRGYYAPYKDGGYNRASRRMNDNKRAHYRDVMGEVYGGSNTSNYATDNASGGLARRIERGAHNFSSGSRIGGELFYNKSYYQKAIQNFPHHAQEQSEQPDATGREKFEEKYGKPMSVGLSDVQPHKVTSSSPGTYVGEETADIGFNPNDVIKDVVDGNLPPTHKAVEEATRLLGAHESRDRKSIMEFLKNGGKTVDPKATPWCAAFVNAALGKAGIPHTNSLVATSYLRWGEQVKDAKEVAKGDVLVYHRNKKFMQTGGHVGIATGNYRIHNGRLQIQMAGGNQGRLPGERQSTLVSTGWYDAEELAIRRAPEEYRRPADPQMIHPASVEQPDSNQLPQKVSETQKQEEIQETQKPIDKPKQVFGTQSTPADHSHRNKAQNSGEQAPAPASDGPKAGSEDYWNQGTKKEAIPPPSSSDTEVSRRGIVMPRNDYAGDSMPPMEGSEGTGSYSECLI